MEFSRPSASGAPGMSEARMKFETNEEYERRKREEGKIATEALKYVLELPEELKFYILHFFEPLSLLMLELPTAMLCAVLQVRLCKGNTSLVFELAKTDY